jgi:hypothetical protein
MMGCISRENISEGRRLMRLDPLREVEVNKTRMSGTTIYGIVPVLLIRSVS